jgi:multidrug efflux pump subunit AcrA (membrane-fusion protein)
VFVGQRCEVVVEVLPDRTFAGEVTRITHQADLQKNTLQIKVRVLDPDPMLRPEMLTRVRFLGGEDDRTDASGVAGNVDTPPAAPVLIPASAVIAGEAGDTVHAVRERRSGRGVVAVVSVRLGRANQDETDDGWVRATGDLRPGDLVVVSGDANPGRRVRPVIQPHAGEEPR